MRRYPLANLCEALHLTPEDLKRRLGLDHRQLSRYLEQGLPEARADELACRLGLVTVNVWPEMIEHAIEDASVECAECATRFVPNRKGHRFCGTRCARRAYDRAKYRELYKDPAFRESERQRNRAYRAKADRALSIQKQQYREANSDRLREARRRWYEKNRETVLAKQAVRDARRRAA